MANDQKVVEALSKRIPLYVRYLGNKVCFTQTETERFFFSEREELSEEEKKVCDAGGGYLDCPVIYQTLLNEYE